MNEFYFVVFVLIAASFWMYAIITAMTHQNSMGEKLIIILKKKIKKYQTELFVGECLIRTYNYHSVIIVLSLKSYFFLQRRQSNILNTTPFLQKQGSNLMF